MSNVPAQRQEIGPFYAGETPGAWTTNLVDVTGDTISVSGAVVVFKYQLPGSAAVTGASTVVGNGSAGRVTLTLPTMPTSGVFRAIVYYTRSGTRRVARELYAQILVPTAPVT